MIIEGKNSVIEAINSNTKIQKLYLINSLQNDFKLIQHCKNKNIDYVFKDKNELNKLSPSKRHQGFIAEIKDYEYASVEDILDKAKEKNENPFVLILDGIEDPHNIGSILRVAECAGVHGVIIGKNRSCLMNDTVYKTSAGAANHVLVAKVTNINYTIDFLKANFINIVSSDAKGELMYNARLNGSIAIVIGSEGFGVSALTKKKSDIIISIPMKGKVNSLNASVASGIICYEVLRQRNL